MPTEKETTIESTITLPKDIWEQLLKRQDELEAKYEDLCKKKKPGRKQKPQRIVVESIFHIEGNYFAFQEGKDKGDGLMAPVLNIPTKKLEQYIDNPKLEEIIIPDECRTDKVATFDDEEETWSIM